MAARIQREGARRRGEHQQAPQGRARADFIGVLGRFGLAEFYAGDVKPVKGAPRKFGPKYWKWSEKTGRGRMVRGPIVSYP